MHGSQKRRERQDEFQEIGLDQARMLYLIKDHIDFFFSTQQICFEDLIYVNEVPARY